MSSAELRATIELRENVTRTTSLRSRCSLSARSASSRPARPHHAGNLIFDDVVHSLTGNASFRKSMTRLHYALPKNIKRGENGSAEMRSLPERDFCRSL